MSQATLPAKGAEPRTPLGRALFLTLLAAAIAIGAFVLVGLGQHDRVPKTLGIFGAIFVVGYLAEFLLIRRFAPSADAVLFPTAAVLAGIGFAVIYRLRGLGGAPADLANAQARWLVLGLVAFAVTLVMIRDHRQLDAYTYTIGMVGLGLLLLPIVPGLGETINGARLWIHVGSLTFQPSELGKVFIIVFLASYLNGKRELLASGTGPLHLPPLKHLAPVALAWAVSLAVLFLEKDLGASLLYFAIFVVMLWVATGRAAYLVLGLVLFAIGATIGYLAFAHVQSRVDIWLHALEPAKVTQFGYGQLAQGAFGMATGGIGGSGLGQGQPFLIPFAFTDFIFAAIGEELGLFGATAVLLLFLTLIGHGFRTALRSPDTFGMLLAAGLSASIGLQTFVIVGGVTRLIPLTGVTLPFVSYGGSSLVSNFIILALLVRISTGPAPRRAESSG